MRISCVKENLIRAISIAERFTGKNITLPILANVLLETKENTIIITATNLEYAIQASVSGKIIESGRVSVPAKVLSSLIQSLKSDKIDLEAKDNNLFIKTESLNTRINGMPVDDFPLIPVVKKSFSVSVDSSELKYGLEKVLPAVSNSEFKPELTGVFFRVAHKTMYLAATDTIRLAEKTITTEGKKEEQGFSFILPHRAALELARTLPDGDTLMIYVGDNQILFENKEIRLVSRLLDGTFPEYIGIVPTTFETTCFLEKNEFMQAVRSSSIFASKIQEVTLRFKNKQLEVASMNPEVGENKITFPSDYNGKEIKISFNYRYLLDALSAVDEKELFLGVNGENSPSLLRNKNNNSFFYVLMPIRLT